MNSVNMIGRLASDPELKTTETGTKVADIRIAVRRWRRNGEEQEPVWVNVTCFERLAEIVAEHGAKGRQVGINGRLELSQWTTDDDQRRERLFVIANELDFLDAPKGAGEPAPQPEAKPRGRKAS